MTSAVPAVPVVSEPRSSDGAAAGLVIVDAMAESTALCASGAEVMAKESVVVLDAPGMAAVVVIDTTADGAAAMAATDVLREMAVLLLV